MRKTAMILAVISLPLAVFSYWGQSTEAGRHSFDEMAGIIPLFAGALAVVSAIVAAILVLIAAKRG